MAQMTLKGLEQNQKKVERIDIAAELWAAHTQNQELRNVRSGTMERNPATDQ